MTFNEWREFTHRALPGTRVRCLTGKRWYQTWRDGTDPRNYLSFGGQRGGELEGILFPFTEHHGPDKCDGKETIVVDVHPFNNIDSDGTGNNGLIHPHYDEIQYLIDGRWKTFTEVMA